MANIPDAGELYERITLQRYDLTARDSKGDETEDGWKVVCTVHASITAAGSREFWEAQAAHAELTHRVKIRWRPDITADMRIVWGERKLDIIAPPVELGGRKAYLILKCREVTT